MNKLVFIVTLLYIQSFIIHAQNREIFFTDECIDIPVYSESDKHDTIFVMNQNFIMEDHVYSGKIIDRSVSRFKVRIKDNINLDYTELDGWIDKEYCKVRSRAIGYDNGRGYFYLYILPEQNEKYQKIYTTYDIILTVENYSSEFLLVNFVHEGRKYKGWVNIYCSNPFTTCN